MNQMTAMREIYAEVLATVASAEAIHRESFEELRNSSTSAKQRALHLDDELERYIFDTRTRIQAIQLEADGLLARFGISQPASAQFRLNPNQSIPEMMELIDSLLLVSGDSLQEMKIAAAQYDTERKKWWKLW